MKHAQVTVEYLVNLKHKSNVQPENIDRLGIALGEMEIISWQAVSWIKPAQRSHRDSYRLCTQVREPTYQFTSRKAHTLKIFRKNWCQSHTCDIVINGHAHNDSDNTTTTLTTPWWIPATLEWNSPLMKQAWFTISHTWCWWNDKAYARSAGYFDSDYSMLNPEWNSKFGRVRVDQRAFWGF